ncbi:MAG: MaoC family dehydratase N-terminal domain-containing protein [Anaeromyxobacteraceae bacterium]
MAVDPRHLGRSYGPYRFTVGLEHLRDFVAATGMGVPGRVFRSPPEAPHPWTWDAQAAESSPHGGLVAPPSFAATFAIEPFAAACNDPALGIDVVRLVHGDQEFEWLGPIRPGDVLTTTGEITSLRVRGPLDFVEVTTTSVNQRGELVVRGVWTAIVRSGGALMHAARRALGMGA